MRTIRGHATVALFALVLESASSSVAAERHPMAPRVPPDRIEEARALISPLPESSEIVEKGKALYQGKGTCANCHGASGRGDGAAAMGLDPSPRDFRHHGFWRHRTEGEIFWVIKNGSPATGMIGFGTCCRMKRFGPSFSTSGASLAVMVGPHGPMGARGRMGGMDREDSHESMGMPMERESQ